MTNKLFVISLLILSPTLNGLMISNYKEIRDAFILNELSESFGGNMSMSIKETYVNKILMEYKYKEINEGLQDPKLFPPARNFLEVRKFIENSKVFKIIQKMPKGALLHAHSTAFVSEDWLLKNATYRDNLYVCENDGSIKLRFSKSTPTDCNWRLLKKIREDENSAREINAKLRDTLTMETDNPTEAYPDVNAAWKKFENIFTLSSPLLKYLPVFKDHFYEGLKELYEDNVQYIELRAGLSKLYDLDGNVYDEMQILDIYKIIVEKFSKLHPDFIGVKLIYAPIKTKDKNQMRSQILRAMKFNQQYPSLVDGFDIVGQEDTSATISKYVPELWAIREKIKLFFHAGETNWYGTESDENLIDAVLFNCTRIGHSYAAVKHPKVLELIKRRNIGIEVSPISNQVLGLVKDLRNHPANILFANNYPVVISNDDPGLWGSKALSYDFYEAFMGMMSRKANLKALKQLALNSINYSVMDDDLKKRAMGIWSFKWNQFLNEILIDENEDKY